MIKFTIDNCLLNLRKNLPAMNILERWRSEGRIDLVGAQRLKQEAKGHPYQPEANEKVAAMANVSEPCIWGIGLWGESKFGAPDDYPDFKELSAVLFPKVHTLNANQTNDVMHLMGHVGSESYAFLTNNVHDFVNDGRREMLQSKFKIIVMLPEEAVTHLRQTNGWSD